jgi:hypothetical protein
MAYFKTRNPDLGKFWRLLHGKCCYILKPLGLFYGYLVYFVAIGYKLWLFGTFSSVGMLYQGKSGYHVRSYDRRNMFEKRATFF